MWTHPPGFHLGVSAAASFSWEHSWSRPLWIAPFVSLRAQLKSHLLNSPSLLPRALPPKSLSTDSPCVKIVTALSSTKKDVPRFVSTACLPCTGMLLAPTMQGLSSHSPNSKPEQYLAGRYCSHIPRFVLANRQHIWIGSKRFTFVQHPLITKSLTEVLNRKSLTSLVAQTVKHLPTMWETQVQTLGQEDLLEKEVVTHSNILAWKIPWMEEPGRLQSMGSQRVGHDWATSLSFFHFLTQPFFKWNIYSFIYLF